MAPYWEHFDNIRGIVNAVTTSVTDHSVTYTDKEGVSHTIAGDDVIVCGGVEPRDTEAIAYASAAADFHLIGDAAGYGDMQCAIRSGFAAASMI